jgi:hypothetical protein
MATNVYMMRDGVVTLGPTAAGISVECQITAATIAATADPKELTTLCGKVTVPGVTAYVLNLEYAQDWTIATGISMFLYENDGELVEFSVQPTADVAPIAIGECYVVPGDFGGTAGEIMVGTVALGIVGKPDITGNAAAGGAAATANAPAKKPATSAA